MTDIGRQTRQIMFSDVAAHLDIAETRDTQVRHEVDCRQVDIRRDEVPLEPVGESLYRSAQACSISSKLRVVAYLAEMEEEGEIGKSRIRGCGLQAERHGLALERP